MRILITGATGFIGSSLATALTARGHEILACSHRRAANSNICRVDYIRDWDASTWLPRLEKVDAVINAVGILRETTDASFDALHHRAPSALFRACECAGVKRVIQISALGADDQAGSAYHLSKKAADDELRERNLDWTIVQPSVVFGRGGTSTALFLRLACLPLIPLVGRGEQRMQPIHIDDLVGLIVRLLEEESGIHQTVTAVGPDAITLRDMLGSYRRQLGLGSPHFVPLPLPFIALGAKLGDLTHLGALSSETLNMLQRGNTGNPDAATQILGHSARSMDQFVSRQESGQLRNFALLQWLSPLQQLSIAVMWISAGLVSWLYAEKSGMALLSHLGLGPTGAGVAFASACTLNIALGIASLRPTRTLWAMQLAVIAFYTAALSIAAPHLWADPFGPLVKNIPLAAMILGLMYMD